MNQILIEQMKLLTGIVTSDKTTDKLKDIAEPLLIDAFSLFNKQVELSRRDLDEYLKRTSTILQ